MDKRLIAVALTSLVLVSAVEILVVPSSAAVGTCSVDATRINDHQALITWSASGEWYMTIAGWQGRRYFGPEASALGPGLPTSGEMTVNRTNHPSPFLGGEEMTVGLTCYDPENQEDERYVESSVTFPPFTIPTETATPASTVAPTPTPQKPRPPIVSWDATPPLGPNNGPGVIAAGTPVTFTGTITYDLIRTGGAWGSPENDRGTMIFRIVPTYLTSSGAVVGQPLYREANIVAVERGTYRYNVPVTLPKNTQRVVLSADLRYPLEGDPDRKKGETRLIYYGATGTVPGPIATEIPPPRTSDDTGSDTRLTFTVETNPRTGQPFTGVADDASSALLVTARYPEDATNPRWYCERLDKGGENVFTEDDPQGCTIISQSTGKSILRFQPSAVLDPPERIRISFGVLTTEGRTLLQERDITVQNPPVVLVHGIWADRTSLHDLRVFLAESEAYDFDHITSVEYGSQSNRGIGRAARTVADGIDGVLRTFNDRGIKTEQVDIVAHSQGGLVTRYYLVKGYVAPSGTTHPGTHTHKVRKVITLDTPHAGSPVANWYTDLWDSRVRRCGPVSNPAAASLPQAVPYGGTGTSVSTSYGADPAVDQWLGPGFDMMTATGGTQLLSTNDVDWFLEEVRAADGDMAPTALEFGRSVRQLQTPDRTGSIIPSIRMAEAQLRTHGRYTVEYYLIAGNEPLVGWVQSTVGPAVIKESYRYLEREPASRFNPTGRWHGSPGPCGEVYRDVAQGAMVDAFMAQVTAEDTDGVVSLESQLDTTLQPDVRKRAVLPVNHFSVHSNDVAQVRVYQFLTENRRPMALTSFRAGSPGTLHVYDDGGNHVGLVEGATEASIPRSARIPYSDTLGSHERILIRAGGDYRAEFRATGAGPVDFSVAQTASDGLHWVRYDRRSVRTGDVIEAVLSNDSTTANSRVVVEARIVRANGSIDWLTPSTQGVDPWPISVPDIQNERPIASFGVLPNHPGPTDSVVVQSTAYDPDGDALRYTWYLDGESVDAANDRPDADFGPLAPGIHEVTLVVADGRGGSAIARDYIEVGGIETPNDDSDVGTWVIVGLMIGIPLVVLYYVGKRLRRRRRRKQIG